MNRRHLATLALALTTLACGTPAGPSGSPPVIETLGPPPTPVTLGTPEMLCDVAAYLTDAASRVREASTRYDAGDEAGAKQVAAEVFEGIRVMPREWMVQADLKFVGLGLAWANVARTEQEVAAWIDLTLPLTRFTPNRHAALSDLTDTLKVAEGGMATAASDGLLLCPKT